jgi:nicotinamidase-related amidase
LVIACGALAAELKAVLPPDVEVTYLPAHLHNRPERIVPQLTPLVDAARAAGRPVFVAYADCGTGGALDRFLTDRPGVERLPGAHCYEFFAGAEVFAELHVQEPGTFFLTDFLARHFDALVWQGLGLDRHPQLRDAYFGNYRRVVLLTQSTDPAVVAAGRHAAERLGLQFEHRHVGRRAFAAAMPVALRGVA